MATYIISSSYKNGYVGYVVYKNEQHITNPDIVNEFKNESRLFCYGCLNVNSNIYPNSILHDVKLKGLFNDRNTRFESEYSLLSLLTFLEKTLTIGDVLVVAGVPYIRPLVRGAIEFVDDFELSLMCLCSKYRATFTNSLYNCNLNKAFEENKQHVISDYKDSSWIIMT